MATVGILGGGQLARMMALAGIPLGLRFIVADPAADACAAVAAELVQAGWDDVAALTQLAARADVLTFDFENVPAATTRALASQVPVLPSPQALALTQDRVVEKQLFAEIGLPVASWHAVDDRAQLDEAIAAIGLPLVLKTRRFGYDGKGQAVLRENTDVEPAWARLGGQALIAEALVDFDCEVSLLAVRGRDGEFRHWPLTRNWHPGGILSLSLAPLPAAMDGVEKQAAQHARALAERLDYVGVMALELFVRDGQLLGNEMAPRVHNSGHWTIEGAACSQFENHLRAILGLPLGDTRAVAHSVMLNWIGELPHSAGLLRLPRLHWHDYGKQPRPGRKVGHATLCADTPAALREQLLAVAAADATLAPRLAEVLALPAWG